MFSKNDSFKKIAVIGLGSFGKLLVKSLYDEGHEIVAIDKSLDEVEEIATFNQTSFQADCREKDILVKHDILSMDSVVLTMSDSFEDMLITIDRLQEVGVKSILARYKTPLQKKILQLMGVVDVFNPEETAAMNLAERLRYDSLKNAIRLDGEFQIDEVQVPKRIVGKTLDEIKLLETYNLTLVTIKRLSSDPKHHRASDEKKYSILGIVPYDTIFKQEDTLLIFGKEKDLNLFLTENSQ